MKISNIITGHFNEMLNINEQMSNERMEICNNCPLMTKEIIGKVCSRKLYFNKKTGKVINQDKIIVNNGDYVHGCGCRLDAKTRDPKSSCPIGKW